MCMKNVNATMLFCSEIKNNEGNINSLIGIYDATVPIRENNSYYLDNFNIALNCCIIFDESFVDRKDCIQLNEEYEFMVRLTHIASGVGIYLYNFDLLVKQDDLTTWCKDFYEFKRFLKFPRITLPKGLGNYAVKLLVRKKSEEENVWSNQVIHSLVIGESRNI